MKWFQLKGPDTIAGVIQARTRQYEKLAVEAHYRIQTAEDKVQVAEELAKAAEDKAKEVEIKANATEAELVQANITIGMLEARIEKLENPKEVVR